MKNKFQTRQILVKKGLEDELLQQEKKRKKREVVDLYRGGRKIDPYAGIIPPQVSL